MTNATMEKLKQKMHIGHHDKADKVPKEPTETPKTAPEPVSQSAPTAAVPSQQDEVVPTGVAQASSSTGSSAPVGNEQLDTMTEPIPQPPPHIAQRLEEHREQHSKEPLTKEAIEADLAEHEKRKEQYQETHHLPPTFDASHTTTNAQVEAMIPPAGSAISDHEKQFSQHQTKEDVEKDMQEHEARRQAILDAKSDAAGREVLEAKKKAEEHNDGQGVEDGRAAPEQPGMFDYIKKTVGLA